MATTLTYFDEYLRPRITESREARAFEEVDSLGAFPGEWRERLARVRAYMVTCLECIGAPDDLFATKLAAYRKEFDSLLVQARGQTKDERTGMPLGSLSIQIERA